MIIFVGLRCYLIWLFVTLFVFKQETAYEMRIRAWSSDVCSSDLSRGAHEAIDLRDGGDAFGGYGVNGAVAGIGAEIAGAIAGMDARDQAAVDRLLCDLDGTPNKARLGANAVVAVSMAVLHAAAADAREPLWRYLAEGRKVRVPLPEIQIFGGGAHAGRRTDVQDFMVMCPKAGSFRRALEITDDVYRAAGKLMEAKGPLSGVADEGGWWPNFESNEDALDTLTRAIEARDRKSTRLNSSHSCASRMPSPA